MGLVDELEKLQQLKNAGTLTEDEFLLAKQQLLHGTSAHSGGVETIPAALAEPVKDFIEENGSLGAAANRYVTYQYKAQIIGAIIAVVMIIVFAIIFMSARDSADRQMDNFRQNFNNPSPVQNPAPPQVPSPFGR